MAAELARLRQALASVTGYTSHLAPHTSHLTPHTSRLAPRTSHLTHHTSHLTPHTSHLAPHTSRSSHRVTHASQVRLGDKLVASSADRTLTFFDLSFERLKIEGKCSVQSAPMTLLMFAPSSTLLLLLLSPATPPLIPCCSSSYPLLLLLFHPAARSWARLTPAAADTQITKTRSLWAWATMEAV